MHQIVEGLYLGFGGFPPFGLPPFGLTGAAVVGFGGSVVTVGAAVGSAVGSAVALGAAVGSAVGSAVGVGCAGVGVDVGESPVLVVWVVAVGNALVPGLLALPESGFSRIDSISAMIAIPATTPTTIKMPSRAHGESPRRGAGGSASYSRSLGGGPAYTSGAATAGATPMGSTVGTLTGSADGGAGEGSGSDGTTRFANGSEGGATSTGGGGGGGGGTERCG